MEEISIIKTDQFQILEKIMAIEQSCITFITSKILKTNYQMRIPYFPLAFSPLSYNAIKLTEFFIMSSYLWWLCGLWSLYIVHTNNLLITLLVFPHIELFPSNLHQQKGKLVWSYNLHLCYQMIPKIFLLISIVYLIQRLCPSFKTILFDFIPYLQY